MAACGALTVRAADHSADAVPGATRALAVMSGTASVRLSIPPTVARRRPGVVGRRVARPRTAPGAGGTPERRYPAGSAIAPAPAAPSRLTAPGAAPTTRLNARAKAASER